MQAQAGKPETRSAEVPIGGVSLVADASGALWWPHERVLVVADLHLEKGSAHAARRHVMLPPYDTRETLRRLACVVDRYQPRCVVALGDSLHDRGAAARLGAPDRAALADMQAGREWIWVTGNHDPEIDDRLGGSVTDRLCLGSITLQHAPDSASGTAQIAGHLHPAAKLKVRGGVIRRPCFAGHGQRLVMPAFGAFTGGLNVLDPAFAALHCGPGLRVWMLGVDAVYAVSARHLVADRGPA